MLRLKKKLLLWVLLIVLVGGIVGCASIPATPTGKYYDAVTTFNDFVESYLWHYQNVSPEIQAELKENVDPLIDKASAALDFWGDNYDNPSAMQTYLNLFKQLQLLLMQYGF